MKYIKATVQSLGYLTSYSHTDVKLKIRHGNQWIGVKLLTEMTNIIFVNDINVIITIINLLN